MNHPYSCVCVVCEDRKNDLARLMAENEILKKDAERYQWLRDHNEEHCDNEQPFVAIHSTDSWGKWYDRIPDPEELDAAIDAALKGEPK